jgi:uncharacterized cupredoxin-like copper-binding protein
MKKALFVLMFLTVSCGASAAAQTGPTVDLQEFSISAEGPFETGANEISITNAGEFGHTLVIADMSGAVVDATPVIDPGETLHFVVDLEPGSYEFSCRIVVQVDDGTLVDHYHEGMTTVVNVGDA